MILFPAIDLKDGACVRLRRGAMDEATLFNTDPAAQARAFATDGFEWLHVVDLNGAVSGRPVNALAVQAILSAVDIPVQLGGGIRDMSTIDAWLATGARRVVLGTAALSAPDLLTAATKRHPARIAVAIDARDGYVAIEGWTRRTRTPALDLARRLEADGAAAFIYTDIDRDGMMEGPNLAATIAFAEALETPVIASGGVASLADLEALKSAEEVGICGVICGRALYDGRLDPAAALAVVNRPLALGSRRMMSRC